MSKISDTTIETIKTQIPILEIIETYLPLKRTGSTYKGLCPFHDEKTPSFNVNPATNTYHCFGCGQSGDNISFLQEINGTSFRDAVEELAAQHNIVIEHVQGDDRWQNTKPASNKNRLHELLDTAAAAYLHALNESPEAEPARTMLTQRGFTAQDAADFGCGYAPTKHRLYEHLQNCGYTKEEILTSGMAYERNGRLTDRFRGRLTWSIKNSYGKTVGFGARRLRDDDPIASKFINTAETPLYKKSQLLYGLDSARTHIRKTGQAIVVEGYTDVMAMHLAGYRNTVATCGTAFTNDHLSLIKRIVGDDGEIIFAFDDDQAGNKAAASAYREFNANFRRLSAMPPTEGLDPDELRQKRGADGIRRAVESRIPLSQAVIGITLNQYPKTTPEERRVALDAVLPYLADVADPLIRREYATMVAKALGYESAQVEQAINPNQRTKPNRAVHDADSFLLESTEPAAESQENLREMAPITGAARAIFEVIIQHHSVVEPLLSDPSVVSAITGSEAGLALAQLIDRVHSSPNTQNELWPNRVLNEAGNLAPIVQQMIYQPVSEPPFGKAIDYARELLVQAERQRRAARIRDIQFQLASSALDPDNKRALFTELISLQQQHS